MAGMVFLMSGVALAMTGAVVVSLVVVGRRIEARRTKVLESELASLRARYRKDLGRWKSIDLSALHPLNREEVERLLRLADVTGVHALSPRDKVFLDNMTEARED